MRPTAKSTDSTNHQQRLWKVFYKDGKELFRYTAKEEGEDEEEATIALLAYENNCRKCSIHTHLEWR